tara:strand:- start:149 stop:289 length:141 start_codon:yes stop_codon:yes gene_type:complete
MPGLTITSEFFGKLSGSNIIDLKRLIEIIKTKKTVTLDTVLSFFKN